MITRLAPHLVKPVPFLYPLTHRGWERPYVAAGLALYDTMGGAQQRCPRQKHLTRRGRAAACSPALRRDALVGAVRYYDAQADDARHTLTVARTAAALRRGRPLLDRRSVGFARESDRVVGVERARRRGRARGRRSRAGVVLNCTGVWTDEMQALSGGARPVPGARVQGRAHRRAARPDHRRRRADPAHRDVGAVRHPVEEPLAHRHDRHRLEPRPRAPGGDPQPTSTTCSSTSTRCSPRR